MLYVEIRKDPSHPGVGLWQLEKLLGWPEKILEFHTWYLKKKGWIKPTDILTFGLRIEVHNFTELWMSAILPQLLKYVDIFWKTEIFHLSKKSENRIALQIVQKII